MKDLFKQGAKLYLTLLFLGFASIILLISFSALTVNLASWIFPVVLQIFTGIFIITVISNKLYMIGFKDSNMVRIGRINEDLFKGLKIGLIAQIPPFIFLIVSVIVNLKFALFRFLNAEYYLLLTAAAGKSVNMRMSPFRIAIMVLVLFIVPLIAHISYVLGYKGVDVVGKFVYKKTKEK